jgi:hypothetical protein
MNNEKKLDRVEPGDGEVADMANEGGSIGDEQCPAYVEKTDKHEWDGAAQKAKPVHIIPKKSASSWTGCNLCLRRLRLERLARSPLNRFSGRYSRG